MQCTKLSSSILLLESDRPIIEWDKKNNQMFSLYSVYSVSHFTHYPVFCRTIRHEKCLGWKKVLNECFARPIMEADYGLA